MPSEVDYSTDDGASNQGLGLHLRDERWHSFSRLQTPNRPGQHRVARAGLRLTNSIINGLPRSHDTERPEDEYSRWSSDSSESENEESDTDPENEECLEETMEQRLERHRRYFQGEPLMRCLKDEESRYHEWMDALFYENLCHEVQHKVDETRRQDVVRAYWKDVKEKLAIGDSEISYPSDLPTNTELEHENTISSSRFESLTTKSIGWRRPINMCSSSGKDLDLQSIRDFWTEKKKKKNLGKAITFGRIGSQESGNISMSSRGLALGRAATFG